MQDIRYWLLQSLGFGPLTAVDDDDAPTHRCWRLSLLFVVGRPPADPEGASAGGHRYFVFSTRRRGKRAFKQVSQSAGKGVCPKSGDGIVNEGGDFLFHRIIRSEPYKLESTRSKGIF